MDNNPPTNSNTALFSYLWNDDAMNSSSSSSSSSSRNNDGNDSDVMTMVTSTDDRPLDKALSALKKIEEVMKLPSLKRNEWLSPTPSSSSPRDSGKPHKIDSAPAKKQTTDVEIDDADADARYGDAVRHYLSQGSANLLAAFQAHAHVLHVLEANRRESHDEDEWTYRRERDFWHLVMKLHEARDFSLSRRTTEETFPDDAHAVDSALREDLEFQRIHTVVDWCHLVHRDRDGKVGHLPYDLDSYDETRVSHRVYSLLRAGAYYHVRLMDDEEEEEVVDEDNEGDAARTRAAKRTVSPDMLVAALMRRRRRDLILTAMCGGKPYRVRTVDAGGGLQVYTREGNVRRAQWRGACAKLAAHSKSLDGPTRLCFHTLSGDVEKALQFTARMLSSTGGNAENAVAKEEDRAAREDEGLWMIFRCMSEARADEAMRRLLLARKPGIVDGRSDHIADLIKETEANATRLAAALKMSETEAFALLSKWEAKTRSARPASSPASAFSLRVLRCVQRGVICGTLAEELETLAREPAESIAPHLRFLASLCLYSIVHGPLFEGGRAPQKRLVEQGVLDRLAGAYAERLVARKKFRDAATWASLVKAEPSHDELCVSVMVATAGLEVAKKCAILQAMTAASLEDKRRLARLGLETAIARGEEMMRVVVSSEASISDVPTFLLRMTEWSIAAATASSEEEEQLRGIHSACGALNIMLAHLVPQLKEREGRAWEAAREAVREMEERDWVEDVRWSASPEVRETRVWVRYFRAWESYPRARRGEMDEEARGDTRESRVFVEASMDFMRGVKDNWNAGAKSALMFDLVSTALRHLALSPKVEDARLALGATVMLAPLQKEGSLTTDQTREILDALQSATLRLVEANSSYDVFSE